MISIFNYNDYRVFLRDYYQTKKEEDPKFSHRYFALKAGIKSSGFFSDVLSGKRNLTRQIAIKFAKALNLKKNENEYFQILIEYCQSDSTEEKTYHYEKLLSFTQAPLQKLEKDKFEFYSHWYYSAIRELLYFYPFKDNFEALAKKLSPAISSTEAQKAIELLLRLDLIKKSTQGYYVQSTPLITTGSDFKSLHVAQFQRTTMTLANEAIDRFSPAQRDSSTITMTLSQKTFEEAKAEITLCRKKLLAIAEKDQHVDRVYQFNMQLFPLTRF